MPLNADAIATLLSQDNKPVFLLGAGASFKSGIPLAGTLVQTIARFAYCKTHNRSPDDPTVMPSDWIRWLEQQRWFRADVPPADLYPSAVEYMLRPQSNRKEFFQRVLRPDVPISDGYRRLASLFARRAVRTVLTTNFDDLVAQAARQTPAVRQIEEIATPSDHTVFRVNSPYPQVVYLHGSVRHYTDRNLVEETQELDPELVNLLQPMLRDHPLVVIGYRGAERSIMRHLLIDQAARCRRFSEGIYWCHLAGSEPEKESAYVAELAATIGSNLQFVEIEGFDELMADAGRSVQASGKDVWTAEPSAPDVSGASDVHDLSSARLTLDAVNQSLLKTKLVEYASALRLPVPVLDTEEHLWNAMLARNIATATGRARSLTRGGQLLFAKNTDQQIRSARVRVTVSGASDWVGEILDHASSRAARDAIVTESAVLTGDLWSQLDQASDLLSRANRPFRLKGPVSQTTYPYPPLALKELLTNLLAHRDYQRDEVAEIVVSREAIRFQNPGGLVDSVRVQLEDESIQQVIDDGRRRLKGYRNPVVAEFFFSAGAMDKAGSGLPDVVQEAANNLNVVAFGPDAGNTAFVATIQCRPEALLIDQDTKTAKPQKGELRYSPNLLRILAWPEIVTKLGTVATPQEMARIERTRPAPFGLHRGWLWTFAYVHDDDAQALRDASLEEEQYEMTTAELLASRDAGAVLPRLLNTALSTYLEGLGLRVRYESGRLRAYYSSDGGTSREISYKSTFRQSKRTVAKPVVSRTTGQTVYWEHKAVALRFEKFGRTWALSLLPGYVFTTDGDSQSIDSERIGPLSTKRASRDYNPTVLHDLVFWSRMLSAGAEEEFVIPLAARQPPPVIRLAPMIPTFVFQEAIETGIADATELPASSDEELAALQEEIERAIADEASRPEAQGEAADQ